MFLDSSSIIAILAGKDGWQPLFARLQQCKTRRYTSPLVVYETVAHLSTIYDAPDNEIHEIVAQFLKEINVEMIHITESIGATAIDALSRYGAGRHQAGLDMPDCFAYACAKAFRLPILSARDKLAQTDIKIA